MRRRIVCLGLLSIWVAAFPASAETIYCTGNDGTTLITVNTVTGAATTIGPSGFFETWAAAFTPDGTLWTIVNGFSNGQLATFDTTTGAATPVGSPMGTTDVIALEADAAGTLYAAGFDGSFYTVNTATGQLTFVGAMGFPDIMDMTFDNSGTLYAVADNVAAGVSDLYTINPATGGGTYMCSLSGAPPYEMGLVVDPATDTMYATLYDDPSFLYQLDSATCATVQIGTGLGVGFPHGGDIFGSALAPVPTLGGVGIVIFIAMLSVAAALVLRGYIR